MILKDREQAIIKDFIGIESWEDRYKKIIQIGKDLPDLEDEFKVEDNKVKGCQSQVWIKAVLNEDKTIEFKADSEALIVKGLVALLVRFFSGLTPDEVIEARPKFLTDLGFDSHLSPSRTNGLYSMIKQIKYYGLAYQRK